ncbi:MAG: helix-turn-helix domain-containing protein [Clostridia bacterium]|nr:helix-turn-helix domain-containing protein [Clostridia bacterium]
MEKLTVTNLKIGNADFDFINLNYAKEDTLLADFIHTHYFYEMHIILGGSAEIHAGKDVFRVKENDLVLLPEKTEHFTVNVSKDFKVLTLAFAMRHSGVRPKGEYLFFRNAFAAHGPIACTIGERERAAIAETIENRAKNTVYSVNKIQTLISGLLLDVAENISALKKNEDMSCDPDSKDIDIKRKYMIETYIWSGLENGTGITLGSLAKKMGLSPRQTDRFIRDAFGTTFKDLLVDSRMTIAQAMLEKGVPTEEVAYSVGYSSYTGFLSAYKKRFGVSPKK